MILSCPVCLDERVLSNGKHEVDDPAPGSFVVCNRCGNIFTLDRKLKPVEVCMNSKHQIYESVPAEIIAEAKRKQWIWNRRN